MGTSSIEVETEIARAYQNLSSTEQTQFVLTSFS
jgi:hypothetical protein